MSSSKTTKPAHVGIILDGNRRWAAERGVSSTEGHKQGFETFRVIADAALERDIAYLSVFAFSTENWNRTKDEVAFLMQFVQIVLKKYLKELMQKNVKFVWLGSEQGLDKKIITLLRNAEEQSRNNTKATLAMCFNYGGQQEIADAARTVVTAGKEITEDNLAYEISKNNTIPPIDLLIRTSGEKRLSNFMLWQAAYSELYFTDTLWPDFTPDDFDAALHEYGERQRRYGA